MMTLTRRDQLHGLKPGCAHRYAAENEEARQRFDAERTVDKLLAAAQEVATQHASMPPADLAAIFIALNRRACSQCWGAGRLL